MTLGPALPPSLPRFLRALASLRLTVLLFSLAIFLVFAGTLAQVNEGIWTVVHRYFRSPIAWIEPRIFFPQLRTPFAFPFPGGWTLGAALLANLLAAHALRFRVQARGARLLAGLLVVAAGAGVVALCALGKIVGEIEPGTLTSYGRVLVQLLEGMGGALVLLLGCALLFHRRAGVVLLHGGIALLMVSELVTGLAQEEGQMQIEEGAASNFVEDVRAFELALVDPSDPREDDVAVVPASLLRPGRAIRDPALPFDLEVAAFHPNAALRPRGPGEGSPATAGTGLKAAVDPLPPVSGVDDGKVDLPAAYVAFREKGGASLGTFLICAQRSLRGQPEKVEANGKAWEAHLRFRRTYKPYTIALEDFRFDRYPGTNIPLNFSSDIRLLDPAQGEERTVRISMNNPLRYRGETFYQQRYTEDERGTILQVVKNPGWKLPYLAVMIVAAGMLAHFGLALAEFLRRRPEAARSAAAESRPARFVRWALLAAFALYLAGRARPAPPPDSGFDVHRFGRLPVLDEGRAKPFDTLARSTLRVLSGQETWQDEEGRSRPAIEWLLDAISGRHRALHHRVFRIPNGEVRELLGLPARPRFRYALAEFSESLDALADQAARARATDARARDAFQRQLLELDARIERMNLLLYAHHPPALREESLQEDLDREIGLDQFLSEVLVPWAIPPARAGGEWEPYHRAALRELVEPGSNPATRAFEEILSAWRRGDSKTFNEAAATYGARLEGDPPPHANPARIRFEAFFQRFSPWTACAAVYLAVFILGCLSLLGAGRLLGPAAFSLGLLAVALHTLALVGRVYISGRPPVTNLYSSAVFIGWGMPVLGLVLERIYRLGAGTLAAGAAGFLTLLVAHFLGGSGDTVSVLQAVLDTQFWLATHVVCITLGYAATLLAGLFGILFLVRRTLAGAPAAPLARDFSRMIYATVAFATFFSLVGTILGGLWADDSWGRFWGWDPKENGALLIVLWNALILHALRGGLVRERGLAVLAVFGNVVTTWSWFGVNELGTGLHSYGFTDGTAFWLLLFVMSQLAVMALGGVRRRVAGY